MTEVRAWEIWSAETVAASELRGGNAVREAARRKADERWKTNRETAIREAAK